MKSLLIALALPCALTAQAQSSRYTCYGQCVVISGSQVTLIKRLRAEGSNFSMETARTLLQNQCDGVAAGSGDGVVVNKVIAYNSKESATQAQNQIQESSKNSKHTYSLFYASNRYGRQNRTEVSTSSSHSRESYVQFSDELPRCTTNAKVAESEIEEYIGSMPIGG